MRIMPHYKMKIMRLLVEGILTSIQRWEDRNAEPDDYRMRQTTGGLWQASQSLRAMIEGEFNPLHSLAHRMEAEDEGKRVIGERYAAELLRDAPVPLRATDKRVDAGGGEA